SGVSSRMGLNGLPCEGPVGDRVRGTGVGQEDPVYLGHGPRGTVQYGTPGAKGRAGRGWEGGSAVPASNRAPDVDGAIVYDGGVTFRVWAPCAQGVWVAGDFNGWSQTATPLAPEGNGYWSADVPGVAARQQYKFVLGNGVGWRLDPCARA